MTWATMSASCRSHSQGDTTPFPIFARPFVAFVGVCACESVCVLCLTDGQYVARFMKSFCDYSTWSWSERHHNSISPTSVSEKLQIQTRGLCRCRVTCWVVVLRWQGPQYHHRQNLPTRHQQGEVSAHNPQTELQFRHDFNLGFNFPLVLLGCCCSERATTSARPCRWCLTSPTPSRYTPLCLPACVCVFCHVSALLMRALTVATNTHTGVDRARGAHFRGRQGQHPRRVHDRARRNRRRHREVTAVSLCLSPFLCEWLYMRACGCVCECLSLGVRVLACLTVVLSSSA